MQVNRHCQYRTDERQHRLLYLVVSPGTLIILILKEAQDPTVLVLDISNKRGPKAPGQTKHKFL